MTHLTQFFFEMRIVNILLAFVGLAFLKDVVDAKSNYKIWTIGSTQDAKFDNSLPGVLLIGGGKDPLTGFSWQIKNCQGGDYVVLRASGDDAYNEWIMALSRGDGHPLNSVSTILFNNKDASADEEVLTMISNAECIFFAGGDQSQYIDYWVGTQVQSIIQAKLDKVTVGGTSAGLAILGNWIYQAKYGSANSTYALENPYYVGLEAVNFVPAFLDIPFMKQILTDTHFVTRDRMGRMLTFVAREMQDFGATNIRGLGIDENTYLALNVTTGVVTAGGSGTAYLCTPSHPAEVCVDRTPLTFKDIECIRFDGRRQDVFSFATWSGAGDRYTSSVVNGEFAFPPYGN